MGPRHRILLIIMVTAAALLVLSAGAAAKTTTQSASTGGVTATFSYSGSFPTVSNLRLQIVRGGQTAYDQPVHAQLCGSRCDPGAFDAHQSSVRVIRLEPGGPPDVILELYSGGAHCCFIDQVFSYSPITATYLKTERDFGDAGARLRRLGSAQRWRFVSTNDLFYYAFTDFADSGAPLQIWSFSGHALHDVTRAYPTLIASDARQWLRLFDHHVANGVGLIAAWAADEELLGHDRLVQSTLAFEARRGRLRDGGGGGLTGRRFVRALNAFLHKYGYRP